MSSPMMPFESANTSDDDGQVIDSFFIETDSPPDLKELNEPILVKYLPEPKRLTRIISGSAVLTPGSDPQQILPPDANRIALQVCVFSPTMVATDGARLTDDRGMVLTAGRVLHNPYGTGPDFNGHTGSLWATTCRAADNTAASAPVTVEYWAVTS